MTRLIPVTPSFNLWRSSLREVKRVKVVIAIIYLLNAGDYLHSFNYVGANPSQVHPVGTEMKDHNNRNLTAVYIYLAVGCGVVGMAATFLVIFACQYFEIDISKNLWVFAIPLVFSVSLNVTLIELFKRFRRK